MDDRLIDANVLLDVITNDPHWYDWSSTALENSASSSLLYINPIIYAEVSMRFSRIEELDAALPQAYIRRAPLPWAAVFLAGKCYVQYRRRGGKRSAPLPDFYIGAHASVAGMTLITRDAARYRTYFPRLNLLCPR